jgi:dienelactone hydrolase
MRVAVTGLALCGWAAAAAAQVPPKYPVEAFGKLPLVEDAELSPDGRAIAAKLVIDGVQRLAILALDDANAKPLVAGLGENDLLWFRWVTDTHLIASLRDFVMIEGGRYSATRLVSWSRAGGQGVRLNWRAGALQGDDVVWVSPQGDPNILMKASLSIYTNLPGFWPWVDRVNVVTGAVNRVLPPRTGIFHWYADATGRVRLGYGYNDERSVSSYVYRADDKGFFKTIDRAAEMKLEELIQPVMLLPDPNKFIARSEHEGFGALYEYDVTTGSYGPKIFGHPRHDVGGVVLSADETRIDGVRITEERTRTEWLDPDLKQLQADLDKALPNRFVRIVNLDRARMRALVEVSSPTLPPAWWVMDRSSGRMIRIATSNEALKGAVLAPMKAVSYKARDGLEIPAFLTLPVGRAPKGLPLIVLPHGGPWHRDRLQYDYWVQLLANRGYAVLQPNFRGSTGYGAAFRDKGDGEWGKAMQDDVTDGVRWAVAEGIADEKRVCIVGGSYGGYAALQGTVRDPDLYRCAVSFAGVSDLGQQVKFDRRYLGGRTTRAILGRAAPDFAAVAPANFAATIKTPILLVHGKRDTVVPHDQSLRMEAALRKAGKPVELLIQPEGDHNLSRQADRVEMLRAMETFLAKHNPAD